MTKIIYREHQEVSDANSTENDIPIAANFSAGNFPEKWKISENILHGESKITGYPGCRILWISQSFSCRCFCS